MMKRTRLRFVAVLLLALATVNVLTVWYTVQRRQDTNKIARRQAFSVDPAGGTTSIDHAFEGAERHYWPNGEVLHGLPSRPVRQGQSSWYRNTRPDVKYVGDKSCATCHPGHVETYRQHPMSHSFAPVARRTPVEHDDPYVPQSFSAGGFDYFVEQQGSGRVHRETRRDVTGQVVAETLARVQWVIGSGAHGRTYLVEHDGYLFQSPISWYAATQSWGLAPSHRAQNVHFERRIDGNCLFCHCDDARPVLNTLNRFQEPISSRHGIGCERCHGPGELHVQRFQKGGSGSGADDTIVNPRRLEPALREAVCEQCHLQGDSRVLRRGRQLYDYRPGLPLQDYWTVFVQKDGPEGSPRAVSQVEQLHQSRCFEKSNGQLGCISCHNPHALPRPADRIANFRSRCLNCHEETSCAETPERRGARASADDCTACHMPRLNASDIAHAALTDHRILRRPPGDLAPQRSAAHRGDDGPVPFYGGGSPAQSPDMERDLGIALTRWPHVQKRELLAEQALPLLESALKNSPDDVGALEANGLALRLIGSPRGALQAFEASLTLAPADEFALLNAAETTAQLGDLQRARSYFRRTIAVNPWMPAYHLEYAHVLVQSGLWSEASAACQAGLQLDPMRLDLRKTLIDSLLCRGDDAQAREVFGQVMRFQPADEAAWRRWFLRRTSAP